MRIGVLAIQGDFREHRRALESLNVEVVEVRLPKDLNGLSGLIVPGGESTTIGRLAREFGLESAVRERFQKGTLALWGTCAGAIWLARIIEGRPHQEHLGVFDATVSRNAYGRQIDSFVTPIDIPDLHLKEFPVAFIRAPGLLRVGASVKVLAEHEKQIVLAREGLALISTFHPELSTGAAPIHDYFVREMAASVSPES